MSLALNAAETIRGVAGSATSITYTLTGDEVSAAGDTFKVLAQGQLPASIGTLYTVPAATMAIVKGIHLANPTGSPVTAKLTVNGTADANVIFPPITILAGGFAVYSDEGWSVYNDQGQRLGVGATGPAGADGADGAPGADGADGVGVPAGGTAGQRLAKIDATDYNTEWVDPADATIDVQEGGSSVVAAATALDFDASDFDVTDEGGGVAGIALAGGGGGGLAHSYIGHNAIGAGSENAAGLLSSYFQAFTPAASGLLLSIGAYIEQTAGDNAVTMMVGVNEDVSGSPGALIAGGAGAAIGGNLPMYVLERNNSGLYGPAWFHQPIAVYLTGGTQYWLQVLLYGNGGTLKIYRDTGGADKTNANGGANTMADGRRYTLSNSTKTYSLRGDFLS